MLRDLLHRRAASRPADRDRPGTAILLVGQLLAGWASREGIDIALNALRCHPFRVDTFRERGADPAETDLCRARRRLQSLDHPIGRAYHCRINVGDPNARRWRGHCDARPFTLFSSVQKNTSRSLRQVCYSLQADPPTPSLADKV
jgi:hypothetical protein